LTITGPAPNDDKRDISELNRRSLRPTDAILLLT
jgi:hypothetical protein